MRRYSTHFKVKNLLIEKLEDLTDKERNLCFDFLRKHPEIASKIDWNKKDFSLADLKKILKLDSDNIYEIKDKGPAGGIIFYDKGYYSNGWRYLEAAPEDIEFNGEKKFPFGYYRENPKGYNLFANGDMVYKKSTPDLFNGKCTGISLGVGKINTAKLVEVMKDNAYTEKYGTDTTATYAAKLCKDYKYGGYSDWFLPSRDELKLMFAKLKENNPGNFTSGSYWSSSEEPYYTGPGTTAWTLYFYDYVPAPHQRCDCFRVRAIRSF